MMSVADSDAANRKLSYSMNAIRVLKKSQLLGGSRQGHRLFIGSDCVPCIPIISCFARHVACACYLCPCPLIQ
jgi:hypothetical protein